MFGEDLEIDLVSSCEAGWPAHLPGRSFTSGTMVYSASHMGQKNVEHIEADTSRSTLSGEVGMIFFRARPYTAPNMKRCDLLERRK